MASIPQELHDLLAGGHNVWVATRDPERKLAMQVKGHAELIDQGGVFDQVNEKLAAISEQLHLPPMKYVVRITVESI